MIHYRLQQLRELSAQEWKLLSASVLLLPLVAISLKVFGFKKTGSFITRRVYGKSSQQRDEQMVYAKSVARMVSIAANHGPYRANCLKKALVIWWFLLREGLSAEIKIGVESTVSDFQAHAWVEFMGIDLISRLGCTDVLQTFQSSSDFKRDVLKKDELIAQSNTVSHGRP